MKRKWKPADFLILAAFFAVAAAIVFLANLWLQPAVEPEEIEVVSGDARITALRRILEAPEGAEEEPADGPFSAEDKENFPEILLDGSIVLIPTADPLDGMDYTLYDANFTELYYRRETFEYPDSPGAYYVVIQTKWGQKNKHYTAQHGFRLTVNP